MVWCVMATVERDGVKYRKTSIEVREDLHRYAKEHGINMTALLNRVLEDRVAGEVA